MVDEAADLHRRLIELLTPLLDDATLYLVTGYRSLNDVAPQPPETRFTEHTLLTYAAMSQLSIEANLIGVLIAETDGPSGRNPHPDARRPFPVRRRPVRTGDRRDRSGRTSVGAETSRGS